MPTNTTINFGDQPIARAVSTGSSPITAQFVSGSLRIGQGYEADVTPRPFGNNNGSVTITDWVQVGRFVAALDAPANSSEFQRADNSPRETFGDGRITLADWVQTGRYVAGLDASTVAGGPTAAIAASAAASSDFAPKPAPSIAESANALTFTSRGNFLIVKLNGGKGENALSFSLNFDPNEWRFISARPGRHTRQATILLNQTETAQGRLGVLLALPGGRSLRSGEAEVMILQFASRNRAKQSLQVEPGDLPVARGIIDARANTIR